jgi:hypothetical protein
MLDIISLHIQGREPSLPVPKLDWIDERSVRQSRDKGAFLFWRVANETGMPAPPLGVNAGPDPHATYLGEEHFGGGSFHLLLRISNGGDAILHTEWAERCGSRFQHAAFWAELRLTNGRLRVKLRRTRLPDEGDFQPPPIIVRMSSLPSRTEIASH